MKSELAQKSNENAALKLIKEKSQQALASFNQDTTRLNKVMRLKEVALVNERQKGLKFERQIVELKLQDYTNTEVAEQVGCSERTVRRILKRIQARQ